jgi:hypothetical protein
MLIDTTGVTGGFGGFLGVFEDLVVKVVGHQTALEIRKKVVPLLHLWGIFFSKIVKEDGKQCEKPVS